MFLLPALYPALSVVLKKGMLEKCSNGTLEVPCRLIKVACDRAKNLELQQTLKQKKQLLLCLGKHKKPAAIQICLYSIIFDV